MTDKNNEKWLDRFLTIARVVSSWSKEEEGGTGAILVSPDGRSVSWGYNGPPHTVDDFTPPLKRHHTVIHAELNAILNARQDLTGWSLAVTRFPCAACALAIAQAGIKHVAVLDPVRSTSRWFDSQQQATQILKRAGVAVWVRCDEHLVQITDGS